jgi:hypothetical protein
MTPALLRRLRRQDGSCNTQPPVQPEYERSKAPAQVVEPSQRYVGGMQRFQLVPCSHWSERPYCAACLPPPLTS